MARKTERMSVRFTKETHIQLDIIAKKLKISRNQLVEDAVKLYCESQT
jgi:predicted HicB family RNase H-like nuclease